MVQIDYDRERIRAFCERHHIRKLSFFGSVLRDDFTPDSDIDVLVEFAPGTTIGLFGLTRIERELSSLLGRKADLHTVGCLSRYLRDKVLSEAESVYATA